MHGTNGMQAPQTAIENNTQSADAAHPVDARVGRQATEGPKRHNRDSEPGRQLRAATVHTSELVARSPNAKPERKAPE